jgi:hypothetical protein
VTRWCLVAAGLRLFAGLACYANNIGAGVVPLDNNPQSP